MELTGAITMDPSEAQAQLDDLHAHRAHLTPEETQFLQGYQALARGRTIVDLRQAIKGGGQFDDEPWGPKIAVARAFDPWVYLWRGRDGWVGFGSNDVVGSRWRSSRGWAVEFPERTLEPLSSGRYGCSGERRAMVPGVPVKERMRLARPRSGGWRSCLTLFEVGEWARAPRPPGDPALLRHLAGWLYTVEATWDLTELEQAVLAGRSM